MRKLLKNKLILVALIILVPGALLLFACKPLLRKIPNWLMVRHEPQRVDAIVVLGWDSSGRRVDTAVKFWKEGYCSGPIVMAGGSIYQELAWADVMALQAAVDGVPAAKILRQRKSQTTAEDMIYVMPMISGYNRVAIVTSAWHSKRALAEFKECAPEGLEVISLPVEQDIIGDWWNNGPQARAIVSELLKRLW